jgi:hypothetical protein
MSRATSSADAVYLPNVTAKRETDKALLCVIEGEEKWIPKSCVHDDSEVFAEGDTGELAVKSWFAEKEGLA